MGLPQTLYRSDLQPLSAWMQCRCLPDQIGRTGPIRPAATVPRDRESLRCANGEPARRRSYPSVRSGRQFLVHLLRELSHISLHYEFLRSARDCPAHLFARSAYVAELAARSRLRRPHGSGDIVRLMQGRKRNKRREIAHHVVIDQHRLGTGDTAMDDAVADAREARLTAEVSGKQTSILRAET
jgi:hypothetical protein